MRRRKRSNNDRRRQHDVSAELHEEGPHEGGKLERQIKAAMSGKGSVKKRQSRDVRHSRREAEHESGKEHPGQREQQAQRPWGGRKHDAFLEYQQVQCV